MVLRPSTAPLRVPLPSPPASSLSAFPDPESDSLRAASPTVARFLATVVTDPSLASTAASALVAELVDFAARCRLDYAAGLVAESASICSPSVGGECALSTDVLEGRQEEFQCFAAALPHLVSTLLAPEGDPGDCYKRGPPPWSSCIHGHLKVLRTSGMGLVLGGRLPVVLTGHADASWADDQAIQRSSQGYTFSLGSGSVSWRSTRSSSVLSSSCEAEIYVGAMAAQELRWLTYLLSDLGEQPRSPPVLYVDNKAMLALCREHRLEHRTKHIALRYFLARELQQRDQLRLAYVASEANTADIFTKALAPGDHQRFCTMLACFALLDWSCDLLFSPTLPMGTQATLRRLEAFLTSQPGFATAAAATTATAALTTPAAVATPTFHGPMAPLSLNLEAARPRLPEAFDPSAKGSDVRRFVATLEMYFEAIGCSTPQHDAARIRLAATLLRGPALEWIYYTDVARGEKTWQQFRADLIEHFEPINTTYMARQQIHRHKQYSSVAQYTQQMELLFNRITDLIEV
ncbi:unnamed protein product [Closterium sp. NIES-53]